MTEDLLIQKLKNLCDSDGKEFEDQIEKSADVLHELGLLYMQKTSNKFSLVQSAGLLNAAWVRKKSKKKDASGIQKSLEELCSQVLKLADAKILDADLVKYSAEVKEKIEETRKRAIDKLKTVTQINEEIEIDNLLIQEQNKIVEISELQEILADDYMKIMKKLCDYCEDVLGNPPEGYALAGLGSLARKEITPYSDFEHIILLREGCQDREGYKEVLEYFRWFAVVFQIVIVNLQETNIRRIAVPSLNDTTRNNAAGNWFNDVYTPCGISCDSMQPHGSKNPLGRQPTPKKPFATELIKPVSRMLGFLNKAEALKNGYMLKNILMKSCLISGNPDIYEQFHSGVEKLRVKNMKEDEDDIKTELKKDMVEFGVRLKFQDFNRQTFVFEVKRLIYRVTTLFICALGRLHGISASSCFDIIKLLHQKEIISEYAKHKLLYAVAIACEIRLRHYQRLKGQYVTRPDDEPQDGDVLIKYVGQRCILNYFQIAYTLQCEVCKKADFQNKSFYPVPYLLNISVCWFLQLEEKCTQMLYKLDSDIEQELEYENIDKCMKTLESEIFQVNDCEVTNEPNEKHDLEKLKLMIERCGAFFYNTGMSEICVEYYKRLLSKHEATNTETTYEVAVAQQIVGLSYMEIQTTDKDNQHYKEAYQWLLKSYSTNKQMIKKYKAIACTFQKIGIFLCDSCHTIDVYNSSDYSCAKFGLSLIGKFLVEQSALMHEENNVKLAKKLIVSSLFNIGECLFWLKEYDEAKTYFQQSCDEYESLSVNDQDCNVIFAILTYMGQIFIKEENFKRAIECFKHCIIEMCRSSQDLVDYAELTLFDTGQILCLKGQDENALKFYEAFLDVQIYCKSSFRSKLNTRIRVCDCIREIGKYRKSLRLLNECLDQLRNKSININGDETVANLYHHIGLCHTALKNFDKQKTSFEKCLQIYKLLQRNKCLLSMTGLAAAYHNVGVHLRKIKHYDKVLTYTKEAQNLFQKELNLRSNIKAKTAEKFTKSKSVLFIVLAQISRKSKFRYGNAEKQKLRKDFSQTLNLMSDAHQSLHNFSKAIFIAKQALEIRPASSICKEDESWYADICFSIARCLCSCDWFNVLHVFNQFENALAYFEKSLKHREISHALGEKEDATDSCCFFASFADCLMQLDRFDDASKVMTKAMSYYYKVSNPKTGLKKILEDLTNKLNANIQDFSFYFKQQHNNSSKATEKAAKRKESNEKQQKNSAASFDRFKLSLYRKAKSSFEKFSNKIRSAGVACARSGDYNGAFICFIKAWSIRPTPSCKEDEEWFADVYYLAAKCLYYSNHHDRALIYFEKSLKHQNQYQNLTGFEDMVRYSWLFLYIADCQIELNVFDDVWNASTQSFHYFQLIPTCTMACYKRLRKDFDTVNNSYFEKIYVRFETAKLLTEKNEENSKKQTNSTDSCKKDQFSYHSDSKKNLACTLHIVGIAHSKLKHYKLAFSYFKRSLAVKPLLNDLMDCKEDRKLLADIYYSAAECLFCLNCHEQALQYFETSWQYQKLHQDFEDEVRCSWLCVYIAQCLSHLNRFDDASSALNKSMRYFQMIQNFDFNLRGKIAQVVIEIDDNTRKVCLSTTLQSHLVAKRPEARKNNPPMFSSCLVRLSEKVTYDCNMPAYQTQPKLTKFYSECSGNDRKQMSLSISVALKNFKKGLALLKQCSLSSLKETNEKLYSHIYFDAARCLYQMKSYDKAVTYFEKSLRHQKHYQDLSGNEDIFRCSWLFLFIGDCLSRLSKINDASNALNQFEQYFFKIPSFAANHRRHLAQHAAEVLHKFKRQFWQNLYKI